MSGWAYKVTKRKVRVKETTTTVRAYSSDGAIDAAQRADDWGDQTTSEHVEYIAEEQH